MQHPDHSLEPDTYSFGDRHITAMEFLVPHSGSSGHGPPNVDVTTRMQSSYEPHFGVFDRASGGNNSPEVEGRESLIIKNRRLTAEKEELRRSNRELKAENDRLRTDYTQWFRDKEQLTTDKNRLEREVHRITAVFDISKSETDLVRNEKEDFKQKLELAFTEKNHFIKELSEKNKQVELLSKELSTCKIEIERLKRGFKEYETKIRDSQRDLSSVSVLPSPDRLKSEVKSLEKRLEKAEADKKVAEARYKDVVAAMEKLQQTGSEQINDILLNLTYGGISNTEISQLRAYIMRLRQSASNAHLELRDLQRITETALRNVEKEVARKQIKDLPEGQRKRRVGGSKDSLAPTVGSSDRSTPSSPSYAASSRTPASSITSQKKAQHRDRPASVQPMPQASGASRDPPRPSLRQQVPQPTRQRAPADGSSAVQCTDEFNKGARFATQVDMNERLKRQKEEDEARRLRSEQVCPMCNRSFPDLSPQNFQMHAEVCSGLETDSPVTLTNRNCRYCDNPFLEEMSEQERRMHLQRHEAIRETSEDKTTKEQVCPLCMHVFPSDFPEQDYLRHVHSHMAGDDTELRRTFDIVEPDAR